MSFFKRDDGTSCPLNCIYKTHFGSTHENLLCECVRVCVRGVVTKVLPIWVPGATVQGSQPRKMWGYKHDRKKELYKSTAC